MAARITQKLLEKPGRNSAIGLCAAISVLVAVNAAYLQPGIHPAPLFQTRAPGGQLAALMQREIRTISSGADLRYPPLVADRAMVSEVQSLLAVKGFYHGRVDGVDGPETRAAIADYERGINVSPTGEPSVKLLARMHMDQLIRDEGGIPIPARSPARIPHSDQSSQPEASPQILSVQQAMNNFGYGPVSADGMFGSETATAIQRFEMNQGMPITGQISDDLMVRLLAIGALD